MDNGGAEKRKETTYPHAIYVLDRKDGCFQRCWVFPRATRKAFQHCRNIISLDGTHTKAQHRLVLLIVSTLDGNGNILPLAWALVEFENEENWDWFLHGVAPFLEGMRKADAVVISDRQKGLRNTVRKHLPRARQAHCCRHLSENVGAKFGKVSTSQFWRAARARTEEAYRLATDDIKKNNSAMATYLEAIPASYWAFHAFPRPRYGQETSNFAESINNHWKEAREQPAGRLLLWAWNWTMNKFYTRRRQPQKTARITDAAWTYLEQEKNELEDSMWCRRPMESVVCGLPMATCIGSTYTNENAAAKHSKTDKCHVGMLCSCVESSFWSRKTILAIYIDWESIGRLIC